jgi:two-component system, OmpR family, phosphate regulon sensor histidine kinase PhoR
MKEKNLKVVVGLMSIALISLIAVQLYWIKNAIELEEKLFDYNVNDALQSVVKKISQNESASFVVHKLIYPDEENVILTRSDTSSIKEYSIKKSGTWVSSYNYSKSDSDVIIKLESSNNNDSSKIIVEINTIDDTHNIKKIEKRILTTAQIDSIKQNKVKFVNEVVEDLLVVGEMSNIEDRIEAEEIAEQLKKNLINHGVSTEYIFGVKSEERDSILFVDDSEKINELKNSTYNAKLFPEETFIPSNYLLLYFPNRTGYLLHSVSTVLIFSALLILAIIFLYYKTVKILVRQKKISEMKSDLINNITHEFKTPLSTISLASEALLEPELIKNKSSVEKYSSMIGEETRRLKKMVDSLLNTALIENGEYKLEKSEFDIHSIIEKVVEMNRLRFDVTGGELNLEMHAINNQVFADKLHITNILNNLLDNAIKYSMEKPQVTIKTENKDNGILIAISDNGIGMDSNQQKKIFETFYRVPTGDVQNTRGYGIGLSYVKRLIEAHGGSVSVESKKDIGTTFKIFLPNGK